MATIAPLISIEQYLQSSYSPDCEYIDGEIVERHVGKGKHSYTQGKVYLRLSEKLRDLLVLPQQRVQMTGSRVRIPDVCVVRELQDVATMPPLLCVEVFSPEDRWSRTNSVISDYQTMGVPCVWVIDPWLSRAWIFELDQPPKEAMDGKLTAQTLGVEVQLDDVLPPASE